MEEDGYGLPRPCSRASSMNNPEAWDGMRRSAAPLSVLPAPDLARGSAVVPHQTRAGMCRAWDRVGESGAFGLGVWVLESGAFGLLTTITTPRFHHHDCPTRHWIGCVLRSRWREVALAHACINKPVGRKPAV